MAAWGGYPQTVNYSTVNVAKGGGSENLLINPRGKINQVGELNGVVAAGQYFCDGWKAGAAGAEIYVDTDGFRLISGSIVQLVPNTIEAGRNLRSNMDVISGTPVMSINGGTNNEPNGVGEYIQLEISGDNSKFSRVILAESVELPIYQQSADEEKPCKNFLQKINLGRERGYSPDSSGVYTSKSIQRMHKKPAGSLFGMIDPSIYVSDTTEDGVTLAYITSGAFDATISVILDARP
ncbi:hypothetical protein RB980_000402 [Vibrio fluvialis]|nr:hypothetical protein [Vibrio fluvialis]